MSSTRTVTVEVGDMVVMQPHGIVAAEVIALYKREDSEYAEIQIDRAKMGVPVSQLRVVKKGA